MGKKVTIKLETGTVYQKEEGGTYYFRYQLMQSIRRNLKNFIRLQMLILFVNVLRSGTY